jgi:hypothetical protein
VTKPRLDQCTHPRCSGLIACHDCGRRYDRKPDTEHDGVRYQVGYAIRKHLKPEFRVGTDDRPFVDGGPAYITPGEGYWASKGHPPTYSLHEGWYTLAEAQEALAYAEDQAREHDYLEAFRKFDHTIVKLTVMEEEVSP